MATPLNRAARRKHRAILRKPVVCQRVGFSPAQVWRKSTDPKDDFPESIQLGPNAVGWFEHEIDAWIENRPRGVVPWKAGLREYQDQRAQGPRQPEPEARQTQSPPDNRADPDLAA